MRSGLPASASLHTLNDVFGYKSINLFMLVWRLYLDAARQPRVFETACVCSGRGTSDTSIMMENGRIREGPLFPQREGENESHEEKRGW